MAGNRNDPEKKRELMLNMPMRKLIPMMGMPTIASMLVSSIYSLCDTFFVSKLGTYATSAVGVNSSLDGMILMMGSFLAMGASSYVSRLLGAKEDEKASQVLSTAFFTAAGFGILILVLGSIFMTPLVRLLGATENIVPYSEDYARYILFAAPFMTASFVLNQCLRAEGSAVFSMIGMVSGTVLNIALDPLFIFVLDLGVAGASMATAISKTVSFCILMIPYLRANTLLKIAVRKIRYSWDILSEIAKMGSPGLFRNGLGTLAQILMNRLAGGYSESALAAISVANRVGFFMTSACLGFGQGFQPVAGFNWGAKRYDRIRQGFRFSSFAAAVGIAIPSLLICIFANQVLGLFTETDEEMLRIGAFSLRLQSLIMPVHAWVIVVNMMCTGLGRATSAFLLSTARQGPCFMPILPLMVALFGVYGLASVQAAADLLSVFLAIPITVRLLRILRKKEQELQAAQKAETLSET